MSQLRDRILRLDTARIDQLVGFSGGNPKKRTDRDKDILDSSLDQHGYLLPVAVRELDDGRYEIIDGHGRVDRITSRGLAESIKVIVLDVESVAEGRRVLLALKHTAEWDFSELESFVKKTLDDGASVDAIMASSGLTAADLDSLGNAGAAFLEEMSHAPAPTTDASRAADHDALPAVPEEPAARAMKVKVYDDDALAEATFEHYRRNGFPYPDPPLFESMLEINRLASMSTDQLVRTTAGYSVADKFQRHRFASSAEKKRSPLDSFSDDKQLRRAIELSLGFEQSLSDGSIRSLIGLVKNTQACSNFRPGFAAHLYRRFCPPGGIVLDTSTGYGGRLVGALASTVVGHYFGIDPNTPTVKGNRELLTFLGRDDFATLIELPAEDVTNGDILDESCDFAFTSPPYFRKEHYSDDDTQSWKRYGEPDAWRRGFLVPMMALTFRALKKASRAAVNIGDVLIGSVRHPLGEWTVDAARAAGFELEQTLEFPMSRRFGAGQKDEVATEPVFIFLKR